MMVWELLAGLLDGFVKVSVAAILAGTGLVVCCIAARQWQLGRCSPSSAMPKDVLRKLARNHMGFHLLR
jgi:hypothetical protein